MIKVNLYKYDSSMESNGYRGEDLSKHIIQGPSITEDITQELDTAEITLCGLSQQKSFDPESKFIMDIVEQGDGGDAILKTYHFCVFEDMVSQPIISESGYYDHHISFIEPSVVAQKRLVDNIATTYKLKDVSLEERVDYPETEIVWNIDSSYFTPPTYTESLYVDGRFLDFTTNRFGISDAKMKHPAFGYQVARRGVMGKYFRQVGDLRIINRQGEEISTTYNRIDSFLAEDGKYYARLKIPKVQIIKGYGGGNEWGDTTEELPDGEVVKYLDDNFASLDYVIQEVMPNDPSNVTNTVRGSIISNSRLGWSSWSEVAFSVDFDTNYPTEILDEEWFLEEIQQSDYFDFYYKKYTNTSAPDPSYITQEFEVRPDRKYVVTISLHQFEDNLPSRYNGTRRYKYTGSAIAKYINMMYFTYPDGLYGCIWDYEENTRTQQRLTSSQVSNRSNELVFYDADTVKSIIYTSSTPYSALALLQKAIINSSNYEKSPNVFIGDINNSNLPFYISNQYADDPTGVLSVLDDLENTAIVENFYNQKNLWEILIDVGHYIHSIPEIRFGNDDRFEITFNRLGRTDEKQSKGNRVSIFNSRSVENYISATSSYIENMVQLGGVIDEYVVPKTTNEQLLIYNDTAEIITSKPIIELIELKVIRKNDGREEDITNYIYEENVYKTLGIDYQIVPNRGIAMYYKLGTNIITGGQFQLPRPSTDIYSDYAFKKIIYSAYNGYPVLQEPPLLNLENLETGYWSQIKVNDYIFKIKYRTKDSVRQSHIRPDIRKYLLNSKYDIRPEHNQFNNQTDVVVDSIKFGNNMFGKLIKTGNNNYMITDWYDNFSSIKNKGELYRVNNELYYVAKTTTQIFSSYVIQSITYSKDYNELSSVVGIPSEPRFYEISEQSLIWREFAINDILLLTDDEEELDYGSNFVFDYDHLSQLVVGGGAEFAKYALTVFKGDEDAGVYGQEIGQPNLYKEVFHPINAYSSENTLTYEWDMLDNYSAGDEVIDTSKSEYLSLWAVPYTDTYGKAALLDFYILGNVPNLTPQEISSLPKSPIKTKANDANDTRSFVGDYDILGTNVKMYDENFNGRGLGLLKDCREAISVNFNLQLATSSDTFVFSPFVFSPNKKDVKVVLLANEVNKIADGFINNGEIITPLGVNGETLSPYFDISVGGTSETSSWNANKQIKTDFRVNLSSILSNVNEGHFNGSEGFVQVKAIAIICKVALNASTNEEDELAIVGKSKFVVARNIPEDWDKDKATRNFYFGAPNKAAIFKNKQ